MGKSAGKLGTRGSAPTLFGGRLPSGRSDATDSGRSYAYQARQQRICYAAVRRGILEKDANEMKIQPKSCTNLEARSKDHVIARPVDRQEQGGQVFRASKI